MYADILILAQLLEGPRHGYELRQAVGHKLGGSCLLNNNQLYPMLRRFEKDGAGTSTTQTQAGRPDRRVYTLTAHGRDSLQFRVGDFTEAIARDDREFLIRVHLFHLLEPDTRLRILALRRGVLEARLQRFVARSEKADAKKYPYLVQASQFLKARTQLELDWIEKLIKTAL